MPMNASNNIQCFQHNHGLTHLFMCLCVCIFQVQERKSEVHLPCLPYLGERNCCLRAWQSFPYPIILFSLVLSVLDIFGQSHSLKMYKRTIKITTYYRQHIFYNILFLSALEINTWWLLWLCQVMRSTVILQLSLTWFLSVFLSKMQRRYCSISLAFRRVWMFRLLAVLDTYRQMSLSHTEYIIA